MPKKKKGKGKKKKKASSGADEEVHVDDGAEAEGGAAVVGDGAALAPDDAAEQDEPVLPQALQWVRVQVLSATFFNMKDFACNFDGAFRVETPLSKIRLLIATKYDHTIKDIVVFQGEVSKAGELIQTTANDESGHPDIDWGATLADIGMVGASRECAEGYDEEEDGDAPFVFALFYDYRYVSST